jgi:hypothetical protein
MKKISVRQEMFTDTVETPLFLLSSHHSSQVARWEKTPPDLAVIRESPNEPLTAG